MTLVTQGGCPLDRATLFQQFSKGSNLTGSDMICDSLGVLCMGSYSVQKTGSLQTCLCSFQCSFWHCLEQYSVKRHPAHFFAGALGIFQHCAHLTLNEGTKLVKYNMPWAAAACLLPRLPLLLPRLPLLLLPSAQTGGAGLCGSRGEKYLRSLFSHRSSSGCSSLALATSGGRLMVGT